MRAEARRRRVAPVIVVVAVFLVVAAGGTWFFRLRGTTVPDLRGTTPTGDRYEDQEWVRPLLDAGFCVDFSYGPAVPIQIAAHRFFTVADSYYITAEDPRPGLRRSAGSTVEVTVAGSPLGGSPFDWDAVPLLCPEPS